MVKVYEVVDKKEPQFDLVDDTSVYMRNDPGFYRKVFYPTVSKLADMHRAGKAIDPRKHMAGMVDKGITSYCKKYNLAKHPEDIFTQEHRDAIIDKLFSEEMDQIKLGEYK
jgi:hypothetical protein